MKVLDAITTRRLLDRTWVAELGDFRAGGRTKSGAIAALLACIRDEPKGAEAKPYILRARGGDLWVLYRQYGSWWYEPPGGGAVGYGGTRDAAINHMLDHAFQYYDDDDSEKEQNNDNN